MTDSSEWPVLPFRRGWRGGGAEVLLNLYVEKQSEAKITKKVGLSGGCRSGGQGETTKAAHSKPDISAAG